MEDLIIKSYTLISSFATLTHEGWRSRGVLRANFARTNGMPRVFSVDANISSNRSAAPSYEDAMLEVRNYLIACEHEIGC